MLALGNWTGDDVEILTAFRLRSDFVERVGSDVPLILLQEFAQEVRVPIEIGRQRNRFVFLGRVLLGPATAGKYETTFTKIQPPPPGEVVTQHMFVKPLRVGDSFLADVSLAFAIPMRAYRDWLENPTTRVDYESVFVSYGEPDADFAKELVDELTRNGVDCWLYSLDNTVGQRSWTEITAQIHSRDKFIVICSAPALLRDGVKRELELVIDPEP